MCTVTFIPVKNNFYLTSNRDESAARKAALQPINYTINQTSLLFPKDADAGGTWITLSQNGDAAILLNGGFTNHVPQDQYRKSRGLIFLDIISSAIPLQAFSAIELYDIAPFSLVLFIDKLLFMCRWTGKEKHTEQLDPAHPYIWSSATLYSNAIIKKREQWFIEWLKKNPTPTQDDIVHFHQFTGDGDATNDLMMNRNNKLFTVSITSIELNDQSGKMKYIDLKNNTTHITQFPFAGSQSVA